MNFKIPSYLFLALFTLCCLLIATPVKNAYAFSCKPPPPPGSCGCCAGIVKDCKNFCVCVSDAETGKPDDKTTTLGHITDEFGKHRDWMVGIFFRETEAGNKPGLLRAMQLMSNQLATVGMQQVQIIGTFFDAKHQMETQRLFQTLTARAHKDYHPSASLCEVGTMTRSLGASSRNTDLTSAGLSRRILDRQLLSINNIASGAEETDQQVRLANFIKKYCDKNDNAKNLDLLCKLGTPKNKDFNKDINFTTTIDSALTLDLDFSQKGAATTEDEFALFALGSNLYSHKLFPFVSANKFVTGGKPNEGAYKHYQDARALIAKRSVATNSLSAITALKTKGDTESQPFIYALLQQMGPEQGSDMLDATEIKEYIGEAPSYYAQMEVLTKKLYQNPKFYSDLYDKPANVMRKDVALQAVDLMQKRDLYRSHLRSEMILAVMLEAALIEEQDRITNIINPEGN